MPAHDGTSIKLDQLLKLTGVAESGAQAKIIIQNDQVQVNGTPEARRGRKLTIGDVVKVGDQTIVVTVELLAPPD